MILNKKIITSFSVQISVAFFAEVCIVIKGCFHITLSDEFCFIVLSLPFVHIFSVIQHDVVG